MKYFILSAIIIATALLPWHYQIPITPVATQTKVKAIDYPSIWGDNPPNTLTDSWGYPNRLCSSYVAYKIYETYHISVANWGTSQEWIINALQNHYKVDNSPSRNSVIIYLGNPGHVQWVDYINKNGTIHVSQFNGGGAPYSYHEDDLNSNLSRTYIHFN